MPHGYETIPHSIISKMKCKFAQFDNDLGTKLRHPVVLLSKCQRPLRPLVTQTTCDDKHSNQFQLRHRVCYTLPH